jgi:N-acyl-D-aspartate/D-glutamate deacylase
MNIDLLLSRGSAIDGTETLNYRADAAIQDLTLREISCISAPQDVATVDPAGLVVTPRFIDFRNRRGFTLTVDPQEHAHRRRLQLSTFVSHEGRIAYGVE